MKTRELTDAQEKCLRNQVISSDQPGTVLHDFNALLDYLRPEGVEAQGKYNLLPMKLIGELDQRLSRPLHLELKRPQIRSHPYLQGLNLLLRASGLTRIDGTGAKARLMVDPEMMVQWEHLNPTERYFNLLEAWLRFGRAEMVGEDSGIWDVLLPMCLQAWQQLPEDGSQFDLKTPQHIYLYGIGRGFYLLALMDLFGLVEVDHPPRPVSPWAPAAVRHLPFGDAIFTLMLRPAASLPGRSPHQAGRRGRGSRGNGAAPVRCLAADLPALFPFVAGQPGASGTGAPSGHVRLSRVAGQAMATDRHAGGCDSGRPGRGDPPLGEV